MSVKKQDQRRNPVQRRVTQNGIMFKNVCYLSPDGSIPVGKMAAIDVNEIDEGCLKATVDGKTYDCFVFSSISDLVNKAIASADLFTKSPSFRRALKTSARHCQNA